MSCADAIERRWRFEHRTYYLRVRSQGQDLDRQVSIIQNAKTTGYYPAGVYREMTTAAADPDHRRWISILLRRAARGRSARSCPARRPLRYEPADGAAALSSARRRQPGQRHKTECCRDDGSARTPSLTEFRSSGSKASSAMNRAMVKPIPVSRLPAASRLHGSSLGRVPKRSHGEETEEHNAKRLTDHEGGDNCGREGEVKVCIRYRNARVREGKKRHDYECDPGMESHLETLDRRQCFAGRDACPMEVAACRRVAAPMVAGRMGAHPVEYRMEAGVAYPPPRRRH